jgi:hypothetical protein
MQQNADLRSHALGRYFNTPVIASTIELKQLQLLIEGFTKSDGRMQNLTHRFLYEIV